VLEDHGLRPNTASTNRLDHADEMTYGTSTDRTNKQYIGKDSPKAAKSEPPVAVGSDTKDPAPITLAPAPQAKNYTMCSPQLLHLDTHNRPLWFNGWIAKDRFSDLHKHDFAQFDSFIIEPTDKREKTSWVMGKSSTCCLTAEAVFELNESERQTLDMILDTAKKTYALGRG